MAAIEHLSTTLQDTSFGLAIAALFVGNAVLVLGEMVLDYIRGTPRRWRDTAANVAIYAMGEVVQKLATNTLTFIALIPFYLLTPLSLATTWPFALLALVAADFTYYWMHRLEHEHRILWALHSVHHSSQDYNLSVSLRLSIVEGFVEWVFLVPMVLLGFDPLLSVGALIVVAQYQTWIHTTKIDKLGALDRWFNTPSAHRVHHGSNPQYLDRNYGGILLVWDHLFGTYQAEIEPPVYGLTKNIDTFNPWTINFVEFRQIYRDVRRCSNGRDALAIVFGRLDHGRAPAPLPRSERKLGCPSKFSPSSGPCGPAEDELSA